MVFPKVASVEDMKRVAEAYVKNTTLNDGIKDPFWTSVAVLVQACVGLLTENETDSDVRMVYFWDNAFSPIRNLRMLKSIHKFNHKARKEKKLIKL